MPFTFKNTQKAVAAFFLIGIFLFFAILFLVGKGSDLFTFKDNYYSNYDEGYGIGGGSIIKYKGINIGKVRKITLTEMDKIRVDLWIDADYTRVVKEGCVMKVQTSLLGSANLELGPTMLTDAVLIPPGNEILSSDTEKGREIIAKASEQVQKKDDLQAKAKEILDYIASLKPVISGTLANVRDSTASVKSILGGLKGDERTVVSDKLLATIDSTMSTIENVKSIAKTINDFSTQIISTNNTIGAVVMDNKTLYNKIDSMMNSIDASLKNVKTISDKLVNTPEDVKKLTFLLQDNLIELKKVLAGIKNIVGGDKVVEKNINAGDRNQ